MLQSAVWKDECWMSADRMDSSPLPEIDAHLLVVDRWPGAMLHAKHLSADPEYRQVVTFIGDPFSFVCWPPGDNGKRGRGYIFRQGNSCLPPNTHTPIFCGGFTERVL
jgi:hypothetical protein